MMIGNLRHLMDLDEEVLHFNNAGVCPTTRAARVAATQTAEQMALGGWDRLGRIFEAYEATRYTFARLLDCRAENVGMMQTCAAALSQAAFGLPLKSGDEILRWDQEYPSNAYPWHAVAAQRGCEVKVVSSEADFQVDTQKMIDAIGDKTRVVAVSWIQFQTGAQTNLRALADAAHKVGAYLVVDAIQGLGVVPFSLEDMGVDVVCGGTHKWLLGPLGHGFIAVANGRLEEMTPILHGAMTYGSPDDPVEVGKGYRPGAKRFEPGNPLLFGAMASAASVDEMLEVGIEAISQEAGRLARNFRDGVREKGHTLISSAKSQSPISTFRPREDVAAVAERLSEKKVTFAQRAGGIRIAPHAINTDDDVERLLALL